MIAIDITKFLKSLPQVRGPAVFLNALIFASLDRDIHLAFNPHYVGSQLYFQVVAAKDFPTFWERQVASYYMHHSSRFNLRRILRFVRDLMVKFHPQLAVRYKLFQKARGRSSVNEYAASVVHHSSIKQMLSFLSSDSMWGLPMPETKKTLFLYDITFFEILRMISSPVNYSSSPFIVGHIIDVNRAISEAHSIMVPTHYLAEQLPHHFPAAGNRPIDVVPLASKMSDGALMFKPLKKDNTRNSALVVCGFDGFKNDNKGMGAILDIICLYKKIYGAEKPLHFTLITPQLYELKQRIEDLDISDCITLRSCIPVSELIREYKQAKFLWVHSIDEGFCLPVLEASKLGTPVVVSDVPPLHEIWDNTVNYIDVFNRYEAVNQLYNYNNRKGLAAKGANTLHAQNYTIEKTAEGVWSALARVA